MPTPRRVLVVDDNPALGAIVRALLNRSEFEVEVVDGHNAAVMELGKARFDLVISDVVMPPPDGFALGRTIRKNPATADIPIIYLTSLDTVEDEFEGYLSGGDAWITKPFRARELLDKVDHVLSGKASQLTGNRNAMLRGPAGVLGIVSGRRADLLRSACRIASCDLALVPDLGKALARAGRESFDLLVCEAEAAPDAMARVRDFLDHFALSLPALFLVEGKHDRADARVQVHGLPSTPEALGARIQEVLRTPRSKP